MKLETIRVTEPCWNNSASLKPSNQLTENIDAEICIIGAGIAGLSIAYQLLSAGKNVIILERGTVACGETHHTSAHLTNALDDRYFRIEKMHGLKKAKLAAQSHTEAINWIENLINTEKIACDFKRIPGYLFALSEDKRELAKEYAAAQRAGLAVYYTNEGDLGKSLGFPKQARFHPLKYIQGLQKTVLKLGGQIYENSNVLSIDHKKNIVELENKVKIKAEKIITATNAPMFSALSMHFKINPQRSYVIGLKITKNAVPDALYWDTEDPYHYVRVEPYDKESDLLIVGGEDHRVGIDQKEDPFLKLKTWCEKYFNLGSATLIYKWSGQILEPVDYMAYIGRNPKNKNAFMVSGDSGNGLTHATVAAILISDLILKKHSEYESLYQVNRLPWRALKRLCSNMAASLLGYIKYFLPQWHKMPVPGEGKIIQRGFRKMAVYTDKNHKYTVCSAICNHMGAVLSWNPIEKTWDCPAHGSRFDLKGQVLNGPTSQALNCPLKN